MKKARRLAAFALAAIMALTALAACAPPAQSQGGQSQANPGTADGSGGGEKVFRFATITEPTSLDPQLGSGV